MRIWQIEDAQKHFLVLIDAVQDGGPQLIVRDGIELAVVLSITEYREIVARQPNLSEHLLGGPKTDGFDIPRDTDTGRDILL